ncbi:MAG TPA: peptidylprolyl isomerase [Blastocatellia bacterium]|nr:peptidylprolyl isomerase [Blastocatellia bacterium]HMX28773.1 peptidylprolyl isomerase [Blastocatellia bacterium]HMY71324.1 peptidylprolyl isomerase [Blastocatellia bacterium]HMZ17301.1 peptidylprolyl isomerase [Blastocatellia bacterium]HNG30187.1 peptidylprolyl isomerase [Blastocatellia bacterium]
MKAPTKFILTLLLAASLTATQSCAFFFKSEFAEVTATELAMMADTLPDSTKRQLASNQQMRQQFLNQFKTPFSLAQAAEAEGLHKDADFKQQVVLATAQALAAEFSKRNPDLTISKEENEAYRKAHQAEFDKDFNFITRNAKQQPSEQDKAAMHDQWAELKIRAEKGQKAGLENDPIIKFQLKATKANALANAYSKKLEEKFKLTPEEKKRYIAEHPEADIEKIRQKAEGLLERLKKGEDFAAVAKEVNEDDTKNNGGELPWFSKDGKMEGGGSIDPEFAKAAFALEKGQFTPQVVKTSFGFHLIKVDDKRTVDPVAAAKAAAPPVPANAPVPQPSVSPTPAEPREEVHTRHIYLSTSAADTFEQEESDKKVKRAMEDATLKYAVKLPADFAVNVGGYDPSRLPGQGGGAGGSMKGLNPNEKK